MTILNYTQESPILKKTMASVVASSILVAAGAVVLEVQMGELNTQVLWISQTPLI